jgi:hypothetical protein
LEKEFDTLAKRGEELKKNAAQKKCGYRGISVLRKKRAQNGSED